MIAMRITQTFVAAAPPELVFDYMTDPSNLAKWQTSKTLVEPLTEGPTRLGTRVRERTKPPGAREFEQIVEFTEFERPKRFHVHIVDGPYPIDGTWTLEREGTNARLKFAAEGELHGLKRLVAPILKGLMARQFAEYHSKLCQNVESLRAG
jgi:uncharacterized protein YndB with AHSA1/START domain